MKNCQIMSSVIATLMGLDEMLPQVQPVPRQQRVLSENYLQKSGAIGKRSRTYSQNILLGSKKRVNRRTDDSNKEILTKGVVQSSSHFDGMQGMKPTNAFVYEKYGKSDMELKDKVSPLPKKIVVLKPNLANVKHASRPSFPLDSPVIIAWEAKKQLLERHKMTKVRQEFWSRSSQHRRLGEIISSKATKSTSKSDLSSSTGISSKESSKYESVTKFPVFKRLNFSPNSTTKSVKTNGIDTSTTIKKNNLVSDSSPPYTQNSQTAAETEDVESFNSHSANEGCSCHFSDLLSEQHPLIRSQEDSSLPSNFLRMYDEHPDTKVEGYQNSPNSVLKPPFGEDNSSISEYCETANTDPHDLWMQLHLLKSESEENTSPEMVTSSDDEKSYTDQQVTPMISSGDKDSRDYSYLVDILDESGFHGGNVEITFENWHSSETMASPLVFEALETKYGKQELWHTAERKLLFDRVNVGIAEIVRPQADIHIFSKPLRRKMRNVLRRDVVEEELLTLLLGEETGVGDAVSEKAVGRGRWFDPVDEVDSLVREIETFLFDELAAEVACA